jgi:ribosome biogenesis GTPase
VFPEPESTTNDLAPVTGKVFKKYLGTYHVDVNGQTLICSISNRLRKQLIYPIADVSSIGHHRVVKVDDIESVDPLAVGDEVVVRPSNDGEGVIADIMPRRSKLSRPAMGKKLLEQIIVANVDQVVTVFAAARPTPKWNLLDRYLVSAESSDLEPIIAITKMDIADEDDINAEMDVYRDMGYTVLLTSAETGRGIDELRAALAGKVSVVVGKSGVGKSSLLNAIQPGLGARVSEVSEGKFGKGKQTTVHVEMFALDVGGAVVDTPGIKAFGLWEIEGTDIALYFRDMADYAPRCKFGIDCSHEHEPGCAVIAAVEAGQIDDRRYESYLRLLHGDSE